MNNKVRILWSGITGRTGKEAIEVIKNTPNAEIVAGVCRNNSNYYNYDELDNIKEEFDVIIDFSHKDSFDRVLSFALKRNKPLIIGTSGLTDEQTKAFEEASSIIPIFRGGNFRFSVKGFIDSVVEYAKSSDKHLEIVETFYKSKHIPSETAKVIKNRVLNEVGKNIEIKSYLEYDDNICDWKVDHLHCRVTGFKELAEDLLKIAYMMKVKSPDGIYDLDKLLSLENKNTIDCIKKK